MKVFTSCILLLLTTCIFGQIDDRTETNCQGESRSIYEVGDAGLPLLIASKGFDCGICQNQADEVAEFAASHQGMVEVWGALTYTYSSAIPTCTQVNNWVQTYFWEDVFSFPDTEEFWLESGTPRYYVINPFTHEIAYEGPSFNTASSVSLSLVTTSTVDDDYLDLDIYYDGEAVRISSENNLTGTLEILNVVGQKVFMETVGANDVISFNPTLGDGIYIAVFYNGNVRISRKIVVQTVR